MNENLLIGDLNAIKVEGADLLVLRIRRKDGRYAQVRVKGEDIQQLIEWLKERF